MYNVLNEQPFSLAGKMSGPGIKQKVIYND